MNKKNALGLMTHEEIEKFEKETTSVVLLDPNGRAVGFQRTSDGSMAVMVDVGERNEVLILQDEQINRLREYLHPI